MSAIARLARIRPAGAILLTAECYGFTYIGAIARDFALAQALTLVGVWLVLRKIRKVGRIGRILPSPCGRGWGEGLARHAVSVPTWHRPPSPQPWSASRPGPSRGGGGVSCLVPPSLRLPHDPPSPSACAWAPPPSAITSRSSLPARFYCGWSPTLAAGSPPPWASLCSRPPISGSSWPSAPAAHGSSPPLLPARQPAEARPIHRRQPVRRHTALRPEHREHGRHRGPGGCRGIAGRPRRPVMAPYRRATLPPAAHARGAGAAGGIAAPRRDLQLNAHRAALSRLCHTLPRPAAGRRAGQLATPWCLGLGGALLAIQAVALLALMTRLETMQPARATAAAAAVLADGGGCCCRAAMTASA